MTAPGPLKPTHKAIKAYREALDAYAGADVEHEGATETAFQRLLGDTARATHDWMLVPKLPIKRGGMSITPDGTVRDAYNLHRGYWEAKDTADDLAAEIEKRRQAGYTLSKVIFDLTTRVRPRRAIDGLGSIPGAGQRRASLAYFCPQSRSDH